MIRKEKAISVGNLIGSNIFNAMFVLPISAMAGGGVIFKRGGNTLGS